MTNFTFTGHGVFVASWLEQIPDPPVTPEVSSLLTMATNGAGSDPWDWDVDRVVQELCTTNRIWQPRSSSMARPNPEILEQALRKHEVSGSVLLVDVDDLAVLKDDLGLKSLGQRSFVKSAIATLRLHSAQYQQHQRSQHPENIDPSEISRSLHQIIQHFSGHASAPGILAGPHQPLLPSSTGGAGVLGLDLQQHPATRSDPEESPADNRKASSEYLISDESGNKRRKLYSPDTIEDVEPQFDDGAQDVIVSDPIAQNGSLNPTPEPSMSSVEVTGKKRKRLAPTLISPKTDPHRLRDIPTDADNVFHHNVVHHNSQRLEPGVPFIGDDGRKRLVPVQQPNDGSSENPYNFEDRLRMLDATEQANRSVRKPSSFKSSSDRSQIKPVILIDSLSTGYLGKRKMPVDDIFYQGIAFGEELSLLDDTQEFCEPPKKISTGRRLYVHRVMKSFLRAERQVFVRGDKFFLAIRPYPEKLAPRFQKPSFTLYFADPHNQIHARREEVPSWPEIDLNVITKYQEGDDDKMAKFNPLGPNMVNDSFDSLDPSNLEKYKYLEGGDEILPLYGDSDEENEYDLATWKEIEEERGELQRTIPYTRKTHLRDEEIEEAINDGIADLVGKWREKILPKRKKKAFRLWRKSRKENTYRVQILGAQKDKDHILERISKMCKEILDDVWSSKEQVRRQTRIMEPSIFDREDLTFKITLLEQKMPPEMLPKAPSVAGSKKSTVRSYDGEEGESIESDSDAMSSDDDIDDFVVPDDPFPTIEEEKHELNLADSEDEDGEDAAMSDASLPDLPGSMPVTPTPAARLKFKKCKISDQNMASDSEDYENLVHPSINNISVLQVKDEEPTLPKLPAMSRNETSEIVDLTMLSSSPDPREASKPAKSFIDLVTPEKPKSKKPLLRLTNRCSPFRSSSPIAISDQENTKMPDLANKLPYDDPAAIAKFSYDAWRFANDSYRMLIKVFYSMQSADRNALFDFIRPIEEKALWDAMVSVVNALAASEDHVQGIDSGTFDMLKAYIRLFYIFVDCRWHGKRETVTDDMLRKVLGEHDTWFSHFFRHCENMEEYCKTKVQVRPSMPDVDEDDEDGEPLLATRRTPRASTCEDDDPEMESSHSKRKKPIFEDAQARSQREQDRSRLARQDERRKILQARLAKAGDAGDRRVHINDAAGEGQGLIYVHDHIARRIKKHQIEGIRFMWNQIVANNNEENTQGCLLAHTMGLGKTMQVITLLVAIAEAASSIDPNINSQVPRDLKVSKTLVLCPAGLTNNWMDELLTWVPGEILGDLRKVDTTLTLHGRLECIADWYEDGGVLVLGYEMFRNLIANKPTKVRGAALSEEQHELVSKHLLQGPNIIIADEAHKMKNAKAAITTAASMFRSKRRVALTGSPLANNVEEYHTMIDWVSKNYLGPIVEFRAKYVEPIESGLWHDSTSGERRKSLKMLGVLKQDLAPKVHRADMSVLRNDLPPKKEFVITVPLTEIQRKAYLIYVQSMISGAGRFARTKDGDVKTTTIWHWLAVLSLLCNHPACFHAKLNERKNEAGKEITGGTDTPSSRDGTDLDDIVAELNASIWKVGVSQDLVDEETKLFAEEAPDMTSTKLSYKVQILCQILDASKAAGDKTLVFSQSLPTLDFLEDLCNKQGRTYARLDGKTKVSKRQEMTKTFNNSEIDIYLISTTAGGLGLNLPSANRVIIFDFKWNPIMEEQAVGRAYRIGQKKHTFVYRFVAGGTFEDSIHNKTIFKMQLASRVVDKKRPIAAAMRKISDFLFEPKDVPQKDLAEFAGMDPLVLDKILDTQKDSPTIRAIVQSDTFERDDDDKLTPDELKEIKQMFEDQQLQRSNPQAWRLKQNQRIRQENEQVRRHLAQLARQHQITTASSQLSNSGQGMSGSLPAGPTKGQGQPPILPPKKPPATQSTRESTTIANSATAALHMPGATPAQAHQPAPSAKPRETPSTPSRKRNSPILGSGTKVRTPTPDTENEAAGMQAQVSPAPFKSPKINGPERESIRGPREQMRSTPKARIILTEAAKQLQDSPGFQTEKERFEKVNEMVKAIAASLNTLLPKGQATQVTRPVAIKTLQESLNGDIANCKRLLSGELRPDVFVRGLMEPPSPPMTSQQEPSSSSSNGGDDMSKVCHPQYSQQTPPFPMPSPPQPTAEVEKSQSSADLVNGSKPSTIVLEGSTVKNSPSSGLLAQSQRDNPRKLQDTKGQGSRQDEDAPCEPNTRGLQQIARPREVSATQLKGQLAREVAKADDIPAGSRSIANDTSSPKPSLLKRIFNAL